MEKSSHVSLRTFIIELKGEGISNESISYYTNRLKEIVDALGVDSIYLRSKAYKIYAEDKNFIKRVIIDEYDNKNMQNIRKECYSVVDCDYLEAIIIGISNMLSRTIDDQEQLDEQINRMYIKTRWNVRKKSEEIEGMLHNILNELKENYADEYIAFNDDKLLQNLDVLKNMLENSYSHYKFLEEIQFEKEQSEFFKMASEINKKSREENSEYDKKIILDNRLNGAVTYLLMQNNEYKLLSNQLDIILEKNQFAREKKSEIKKIQGKIKELKEKTKNEVLSLDTEKRKILTNEAFDIRNILKRN